MKKGWMGLSLANGEERETPNRASGEEAETNQRREKKKRRKKS